MTFDEVKAQIMINVRRYDVCDGFHELSMATTYQELIYAALPYFEYGWKLGLITTDLLDEFPAGILEENGIYYNQTATISAPPVIPYPFFDSYEIFIVGGSVMSVAFTGDKKYKVNVWDATATIEADTNVFLQVQTYNGDGTINIKDDAIACMNLRSPTEKTIEVNLTEQAIADIFLEANTVLNLDIQDDAFSKLKTYSRSVANTNVDADETFIVGQNYNSSLINYNVPV